jgi:hypothetical protein
VFNYTEMRLKFSKIVQESRVVSSVRGVHGIQVYHIRRHIFTKTDVLHCGGMRENQLICIYQVSFLEVFLDSDYSHILEVSPSWTGRQLY